MKERNATIDIIRGFAMLLVVLGHTISGTVREYSDSMLFQIVWTLQMPLFILISGYVTCYSKPIYDGKSLWQFIKKRTLSYLLPWVVWTILVRGLVFGEANFLNMQYMLWHMDSGYWFLATIWTISMIYGLSDYLSNKCRKGKKAIVALHILICLLGWLCLSAIGYMLGIEFFAIKLTLYYTPIYLFGYLYGQIQDRFLSRAHAKSIVNVVVMVSLCLWLAVINRFDFFYGAEGIGMIAGRFITSMLGCIAVIGLFSASGGGYRLLNWAGVHSLEVYLTHYLFLSLTPAMNLPILASKEGMVTLLLNYMLTLTLTLATIKLVQCNPIMNRFLYAKRD